MNKTQIDYQKVFDEFWKDLVCNPDGSLNVEQVKKELADFHFIMEQVPKVYCHVTGDTLSKLMYTAESVIQCANNHNEKELREQWIEGYNEAIDNAKESGSTDHLIKMKK